MKKLSQFLFFLGVFPVLSYSQELKFIKEQTNQGFILQYHVLASDSKIRHGLFQEFENSSGGLLEKGYYKHGLKDSIWIYYDFEGNLSAQGNYLRGMMSGRWKFFAYNNSEQVVASEGNYKDDEKDGEWIFRNKNGDMIYKYDYSQKKITEYGKNDQMFTIIDDKDTITTLMDKPTIHVGGTDTLMHLIRKNLRIVRIDPAKKNVNGIYRVLVSFDVNEKGKLTDYNILRGAGKSYDDEALRVIKMWDDGNWVAGYYKGHPAKVLMVMPITYEVNYP